MVEFDLVTQEVRLENDGLDSRKPNSEDVNRFKKKVNKKLQQDWKLEQFSSSEMHDCQLFVQTFTK